MSFDKALAMVLEHEGGYVNDPRDPGGETKFGIAKRSHPTVDIKNLTPAEAGIIYRRDYWNKIKGDDLPESVAIVVFDCAVNCGVGWAAKALQMAVGATPDGAIGPATLAAVKKKPARQVVEALTMARVEHYQKLPTWPTFGAGWFKRSLRTHVEACKALA